ncbi:hypothetical protein CWATWH8502_3255 [Crocosphaera watsonii WH 8502]|uniref:Uncharacterized protein n=2 Tax=Crocosphaera watsonii TaxID=263511 RepID=T2J4G6_CROWT|nr:hypothetical protein CWATWH8502_3255 [Crocosphaera watsonii WH 8502]CCQ60051.1 hypothetical protein CWATWH0401_1564 [Crocosphaera watsonii WH 0401]
MELSQFGELDDKCFIRLDYLGCYYCIRRGLIILSPMLLSPILIIIS